NVLRVLNRDLDGDFDVEAFAHAARWDPKKEWIEMRLRARQAQVVHLKRLDLRVEFVAGEELRTEGSAKVRREGVAAELAAAGFVMRQWCADRAGRFGVSVAQAV